MTTVTFKKVSKKKRRWQASTIPDPYIYAPDVPKIESLIFKKFYGCTITKGSPCAMWYNIIIQLKNDAQEAEFIMWAFGGVEI